MINIKLCSYVHNHHEHISCTIIVHTYQNKAQLEFVSYQLVHGNAWSCFESLRAPSYILAVLCKVYWHAINEDRQ